jgi:hypothetical protein
MIKKSLIFVFFALIFFSSLTMAQELIPELVTDRPDQTESAITVPNDYFQIEVGFLYQKEKYFDGLVNIENDNLIFGSTLLRYGINSRIELRFGGEYLYQQSFADGEKNIIQGMQNFLVGTKVNLWREHTYLTNLAVIIQAIIPFGNKNLRPDRFQPDIKLCVGQYISDRFSLGLNFGAEDNDEGGHYFYNYTASLGFEINDRLNSFFEVYGDARKGSIPSNNFDCGMTYLFTTNIQIDFSFGTTLLSTSVDWFGGFGISMRLPK